MGLQNCEITLDNPWNTYYAGQTLNGQVKLSLDKDKTIRGMEMQYFWLIFLFYYRIYLRTYVMHDNTDVAKIKIPSKNEA